MRSFFSYLLFWTCFLPSAVVVTAHSSKPSATAGTGTTQDSASDSLVVASKSVFQVGVGLGVSVLMQNSYSYALTAPNYFLQQQTESFWWPVASAVVCYNPSFYYIKHGDEKKPASEQRTELKASHWAGFAALNLGDVFKTTLGFNQHTSLGLGLGYRVGNGQHLYVAGFMEGSLTRFLRDSYNERMGNTLPAFPTSAASGTGSSTPAIVTSLNLADDTYFVTRPVVGISLKLIYMITGGAPKLPVIGDTKSPR